MKCSVIVANYNNAPFIIQTLKSVEQQTYTNWEVIIVDDGSTDNSLQTIDTYLAIVPDKAKYKIVPSAENKGVGNAKRIGITESNGELIFLLDADDALAPTALEELTLVHKLNPNASLIYSTHYNCDSVLTPIDTNLQVKQVINSHLLEDCISHLVSIKRHFYNLTTGLDPYFKLAEDMDLYYKLEEVGDAVFVNKPLYFYRISDRGISRGFDAFVSSRDYKLVAIENALKRRKVSGVKMPAQHEIRKLMAEIHLLQAESLVYSEQALGLKFVKHLGLSVLYEPFGSIKCKIKTAFLLSRLKRILVKRQKL